MQTGCLLGRYEIREPELTDAAALAAAYDRNRDHLAPFEPRRLASFYRVASQHNAIRDTIEARRQLRGVGWLIFDERRVIGRINLNNLVHGVLRSADLGYWIDAGLTGQGLGTAATEFVCAAAADLGLHRVGASTLTDNAASQAVLRKTGFQQIGRAPAYLFINGAWRDHDLFQRILHEEPLG